MNKQIFTYSLTKDLKDEWTVGITIQGNQLVVSLLVCGVTQTSQFSVCFRFKPRLLTQSSQKESLPFICTQIFSNNLFRHFFRPKSTTIYMHLLERNTRSFWYHFLNTVLSYLPQPGRTQTEQAKGTSSFIVFFLVIFSRI